MQSTGSISRGKMAPKHNTRECYPTLERTPTHIDRARMAKNVTLVSRELSDVYAETFGDALKSYNAKQAEKGHPERQIGDYLAHVAKDKKLHPAYEFVVQLGNEDAHPDPDTCAAVYRDWLDVLRMSNFGEHFAIAQAIVHMDESTPHMHLEVVPVAESKRGLAVQNSMNRAIKQSGCKDYKDMLGRWDALLTACMKAHGIERVAGERERQMGGVDIHTYKRTMAALAETRGEVEKARQELGEVTKRAEEKAEDVRQLQALWLGAKDLVADLDRQVADKTEERDGIQVQIDQTRQQQGQEVSKLQGLMDEVAEKRGLAADLSAQIEKKTAEKVEIQAQISDFSEKASAAAQRLECVQGDLAAVESIEAAGLVELGKLAAGAGDGGRESAARSQNKALRARLAALEEEGDGLAGRVRSLEEEKRGLEDENRGLGSRLAGLSRRLDDAWRDLVDAAVRVKNYVFEQVEGLKWVFDALGLTAYEGMVPLAHRGYDLDSECRDARAASAELGRSWESPEPSHGRAR